MAALAARIDLDAVPAVAQLPTPSQRQQNLNLHGPAFIHFAQTLRGGRQREDVVLLADVMEDVSGSRPQYYIRDTEGREVLLKFELDSDATERRVVEEVSIGGMVALRNPHVHHFMDGSVGLRVEEDDMLTGFKAFGCSVDNFRKLNERLMYTTRHAQCEQCGTADGRSHCAGCMCTRYCSRVRMPAAELANAQVHLPHPGDAARIRPGLSLAQAAAIIDGYHPPVDHTDHIIVGPMSPPRAADQSRMDGRPLISYFIAAWEFRTSIVFVYNRCRRNRTFSCHRGCLRPVLGESEGGASGAGSVLCPACHPQSSRPVLFDLALYLVIHPPSPQAPTMPAQDRTNEFRACVQSIRSRSAAPRRQRTAPTSKRSEFASMASNIGKDISATTVKLGKLAQLAKRKTLFDDKPVEISELTYIIKQDIANINKQIASLQAYVKSQGQGKAGAQKQIEEHNHNVVMLLQNKLADTSVAFKDVLEIRTKNMKESKDRTEQFMYSTAAAANQAPAGSSSLLYAPREASDITRPGSRASFKGKGRADAAHADVFELDIDAVEEGRAGGSAYQQMQLVEQQDTYIQSRSTAIESIESTIAELGQIFQQLATMVAEQRETVQRIDADTVDIASNVSGAQRELLKYYASISSNRWLMLKIFGVLIVFFLVFILVS